MTETDEAARPDPPEAITMVKIIALLKRKAGLTREEFSSYWHDQHTELSLRVAPPEVLCRRYVQNHALALGQQEAAYDAVAELCFEDISAMRRWIEWYESDAGKPLRDDEIRFLDVDKRVIVVTDERVLRDELDRR